MTVHEIVTGVVEQRNAKGIMVDQLWCNVSKFAPLELPPIGAQVRVSIDTKGFIVALEVLEQSYRAGPVAAAEPTSSRDHTIARLTVLKAAAHFAAARTDIKSADVLRIADAWLQWVEQ